MRPPDVAVETGVEMDVTFDKSGHEEFSAEIDGFGRHRSVVLSRNRDDASASHQDTVTGTVAEPRIDEELFDAHGPLHFLRILAGPGRPCEVLAHVLGRVP
jgi:hypothetical protein